MFKHFIVGPQNVQNELDNEKINFLFIFIFSFKKLKKTFSPRRRLQKRVTHFFVHFRITVKIFWGPSPSSKATFQCKFLNFGAITIWPKFVFKNHSTLACSSWELTLWHDIPAKIIMGTVVIARTHNTGKSLSVCKELTVTLPAKTKELHFMRSWR